MKIKFNTRGVPKGDRYMDFKPRSWKRARRTKLVARRRQFLRQRLGVTV